MKTSVAVFCWCLFVLSTSWSLVEGNPRPQQESLEDGYNYDDDDYKELSDDEAVREEEVALEVEPTFRSQGQTFTVDKGTTITLPCLLDQFPKNYVVMWQKIFPTTVKLIAMGDKILIPIYDRDRFQVELRHEGDKNGSTLTIGLATEDDAGQYVCVLGSNKKKELKHTVYIRAPPEISKSPQNGQVLARKGDSVNMRCQAEGDPAPNVTWTRIGKRLPDGRRSLVAEEIRFANVDRRHSGTYVCTADNGYAEPAKEKIEVSVEYGPEVEVEELFVHATAGNSVELVCLVHAHPRPAVRWFKNSMELTAETAKLEKHGHKHILMLPSVTATDLGNYTCSAENKMGFAKRILEVSGKAGFADFRSDPKGNEPDSFLLEWQSESRTPITSFELKYRRHGDQSWRSVEIDRPIQQSSFVYAGKHSITGLQTATRYEATVAAKNDEGWSRDSPVFNIATFGAEPLKDTNSAASSRHHPLSRSHIFSSSLLLSVAIAAFSSRGL